MGEGQIGVNEVQTGGEALQPRFSDPVGETQHGELGGSGPPETTRAPQGSCGAAGDNRGDTFWGNAP